METIILIWTLSVFMLFVSGVVLGYHMEHGILAGTAVFIGCFVVAMILNVYVLAQVANLSKGLPGLLE